MKSWLPIFCFVLSHSIIASEDLLRSHIIIPSSTRDKSTTTNAETAAALHEDADVQSIYALYHFLITVHQQENGKLRGNSLKQMQSYWKEVEPHLKQKFHAQKRYGLEMVDTITQSLKVTLEETNTTTVSSTNDTDFICTIRTYTLPIHINNDSRGFKTTIMNIFNTLVKEYAWRRNNKHNPYPINLFPHNINRYLVFNTPQDRKMQTPIAPAPSHDAASQNIIKNNALDDSYVKQLEEEDKDLCQLMATTNFGSSSILYQSSTSSTSGSQSGSGKASLAASLLDSEMFTIKTPLQSQYATGQSLTPFKNPTTG